MAEACAGTKMVQLARQIELGGQCAARAIDMTDSFSRGGQASFVWRWEATRMTGMW